MSSILKALKKLEQEKAVRKQEEIDLSREILQDAAPLKKRLPWQGGAVIVAIIFLALAAAILLRKKPTGPMQANTLAPPSQTAQPLTPVEGVPVTVQQQPATPAEQPNAIRVPVPATTQAKKSTSSARPEPKGPAVLQQTEPARQQTPNSAEELSVSGIAWNKDSSERLAIVNGQPLTTGSVIGNAIVEEIFKDRVRFSSSGKSFEIAIGKSGHTN